jgi:hypothetical protein
MKPTTQGTHCTLTTTTQGRSFVNRNRLLSPAVALLMLLPPLLATADPKSDKASPSVWEGYTTPQITVPYAKEKPVIDGTVNDDEWRHAASINGLQTLRGQVAPRQTQFWFMWDEDNLYMAMRSPLRPGERPLQRMRRRDREQSSLVFDDSYEIWLDTGAEDPRTGLDCYFQYLSNPAGKPYDTMHLPTVGNSRRGYDTNWEPVNRITPDGKAWEWELIIPRTSIFYDQPFSDGFEFGCLQGC